ncbi:MAG: LegC family aminotransferase [Gammaproteobacteria bacterium]|nr:LegC family aminotransferase [Gammaproteobacteria bacterium]
MFESLVEFVRDTYRTSEFIPLHAPTFAGKEREYVNDTLESTFVSSVGNFVDRFEEDIQRYTGTPRAVATVNGTAALHTALYMAGVKTGDLVITQALTFVATCNALFHMGVNPVFLDVSSKSLGLSPLATQAWLEQNADLNDLGQCFHKASGARISAVVPMHTFGHPVELDELVAVCSKWRLPIVEDAAESLGSLYKGRHAGTVGDFGALSFNGNKIITTGSGGMVLCRSAEDGARAKHVTTTAKVSHPYEFYHDEPGFNYRLSNLNAALGCAQMEQLPMFLQQKRELAQHYARYFHDSELKFVTQPDYAESNYWLNAVICPDTNTRERLLEETNEHGVMTRPIWKLMHRLPMFSDSIRDDLRVSERIEAHLVNLPSSPIAINSNSE